MNRNEIIELLESLRLPEEKAIVHEIENEERNSISSDVFNKMLNDPDIYGLQEAFPLYDDKGDTIISKTANDINECKLNPFKVNWMEVTLYETNFIRQLLERIDSRFILDVAQAIDDEDKRHEVEDGFLTQVISHHYGTGKVNPFSYSYKRENNSINEYRIPAISIAESILDIRKKAEEYEKKFKADANGAGLNKQIIEIIDDPDSHLHIQMKDSFKIPAIESEVIALREECDGWKKKYEEALAKEPEKAFNASGNSCFTKAQMGLLIYTIASINDGPTPIKTKLVPIISAIGGWETTSVSSEMRKAGFNQNDIDVVAKIFENAMPNFAKEVKKQIARITKAKK